MSNWFPIHVLSHYSVLSSVSKTQEIIDECIAKNYATCGLTDTNSISGVVEFLSLAGKKSIKPILGCELNICSQDASIQDTSNRKVSRLIALAKNDNGYRNLAKLITKSNELFYYTQRIDLNTLAQYSDDLIIINGYPRSQLAEVIENEGVEAGIIQAKWFQSVFSDRFFLEVNLVDGTEQSVELAKLVRLIATQLNIKKIAGCESHYCNKTRVEDHRVILCSAVKSTMKYMKDSLKTENSSVAKFFACDTFDIPTKEFMEELHAGYPDELDNCQLIADSVTSYNILQPPTTPKFDCQGKTETEYLLQLCREGWIRRGMNEREETKQTYVDRVKKELAVIQEAKLEGYFLIVQDYVNWAKNKGYLVGPARGSAGGSLVAYLLGITEVNPIPVGLLFERFYNAGRNSKDNISMPDIDVDFPKFAIKDIHAYLKDKYGEDKVGSICTFGTLQGRAALKEVMRVHGACDHTLANEICKKLPDKTDILEELEESDDGSMIHYTLLNEPKLLQEWCKIDKDGNFTGSLAKIFEQAIRLEGTIKSVGKHAAGVVIANESISDKCPLIRSSEGTLMCGFEMKSVEKVGYVKFDILTTEVLDVLQECNQMIARGEF